MLHIYPDLFQKEEINSCEERVKKLLEMTPPKGKEFLRKIEHVLEREKNWVSSEHDTSFFLSVKYVHIGMSGFHH